MTVSQRARGSAGQLPPSQVPVPLAATVGPCVSAAPL